MSDAVRIPTRHVGPTSTDLNISRVVSTLLGHKRQKASDLVMPLAYAISKATLYARLKNEGAGWTASEIQALADYFEVSPGLFYDDADLLLRSRCFPSLTLVTGSGGQGTLPFDRPNLTLV